MSEQAELTTDIDGPVATIEIHRPPDNYFDIELIRGLADELDRLAAGDVRTVVLGSEGKHFCAGANFAQRDGGLSAGDDDHLYDHAVRIFDSPLIVVAAVQGAAIGGGLGLALAADFRVATPGSKWSANFARLGFHQGFGLSVTLPWTIGQQAASSMLYRGTRLSGDEAMTLGLCDQLAEPEELRDAAQALATDIAMSAPLALRSVKETLRRPLADQVRVAVVRERAEQERLMATSDFREGVAAMADRRPPAFEGR